jgi:adhesin transport system membrane fusion protein
VDTPLIKIDATQQNSDLQEIKRQLDVLNAKKERLQAELEGRPLNFSPDLKKSIPKLLEKEEELYNSRTRQYLANKNYYDEKINEANSKKKYTGKSLILAKKELDATKPLLKDRAVSEVEVLKLESSYNELKSNYASILIDIKALTSQRDEKLLAYRNETQEELSEVIGNIKIISPSQVGAEDRVSRAIIRSPIDGIVQRIISATVGSVVEAGEDIIEILPLEDTLLIEAKVKPTDIGFIEEGQKATVKFSAFDFTIYGGLEGELIHISPDAIVEKNGNTTETFYLIKVKTNKNYLGSVNMPLKIIPGMESEVDILTGKKTILSFLLKPVLRAKYSSLRER